MNRGAVVTIMSWAAVSLTGCAFGVAVSSDSGDGEGGSVTVGPGATGGTPSGSASPLDRTVAPSVGPPPSLAPPEAADYTLDNGLRVILVERHTLPLVSMALQFNGGAAAHPASQAGLAGFTADMLDEGTATRSALEISEELDFLGAELSTSAGYDVSVVRLNALEPQLDEAMAVLGDLVMNPKFAEADLERVRRERLGRILQRSAQPAALADDAFLEVLYGQDHPYGAPLMGSSGTLSALTREDVVTFHRERYAPGQATLVVVGDIDREEFDSLVSSVFDGWEGEGVAPPPLAQPDGHRDGRVVFLVDRPGSAQSEVRVGRVGLARSTDRYVPTQVANTVLGGSFTSRLNSNLREDKGYTYGAGSFFDLRREPGPFEATASVATPSTAESVVEFLAELDRMGREQVPADELERARNFIALRLPQRFETIDDVVARLAELAVHDVPLDFYAGYVEDVIGVGGDEVQRVGTDLMDPEGMVIVIAGDVSVIEAPLRALGIGPVHILSAGQP